MRVLSEREPIPTSPGPTLVLPVEGNPFSVFLSALVMRPAVLRRWGG